MSLAQWLWLLILQFRGHQGPEDMVPVARPPRLNPLTRILWLDPFTIATSVLILTLQFIGRGRHDELEAIEPSLSSPPSVLASLATLISCVATSALVRFLTRQDIRQLPPAVWRVIIGGVVCLAALGAFERPIAAWAEAHLRSGARLKEGEAHICAVSAAVHVHIDRQNWSADGSDRGIQKRLARFRPRSSTYLTLLQTPRSRDQVVQDCLSSLAVFLSLDNEPLHKYNSNDNHYEKETVTPKRTPRGRVKSAYISTMEKYGALGDQGNEIARETLKLAAEASDVLWWYYEADDDGENE